MKKQRSERALSKSTEPHPLPPGIQEILDRVDKIRIDLNSILIDRTQAINMAVLALIARENIILLGPPGTAKSLLASELCKRIENERYFQRLLTKFTKESELFVSGQGILEEVIEDLDTRQRVKVTRIKTYHEHMLPQANIAFLDEVFKGNSAILNSLLTLMNERVYYTNDGKPIPSQLITLFGASNERPNPEDGLDALYDRFLIRYHVDYLAGAEFKRLLNSAMSPLPNGPLVKVSVADLQELFVFLDRIVIPSKIIDLIYQFRERLDGHPNLRILRPSDRRMKNSLKVLRANALLHRRTSVDRSDFEEVYPYILWDTAPGTSNNFRVQLLEDLIKEIKKENPKIQDILEYSKKCEEHRRHLDELSQEVRKLRSDQSKFKSKIADFQDRATKITAELETYRKELGDASAVADYDETDKVIIKNLTTHIGELITWIEKQSLEYIHTLRNLPT